MKFIKFSELLSPKFGASKRKVYDILLKFNHPKVNLKVSYTMKVPITRYSCFCRIFVFPFLFVQARGTRANGEENKKAIGSFHPSLHITFAQPTLLLFGLTEEKVTTQASCQLNHSVFINWSSASQLFQ